MRRVSTFGGGADRCDRALPVRQHSDAASSHGAIAANGLRTLAPEFLQSLPSVEGQRTEYSLEVHGELLYELCAALVRSGLGTSQTWRQSGENSLTFAQHAIMSGIGADRGDLLQRNVEYHLDVSDVLDAYGDGLLPGQLAATISCSGCGYLKIGPAIEALEKESEGLGAAFYWALTRALYRVMRLYDHKDAFMYEERLIEYIESDNEENREQYEFPEVEKALPECIRKTLKNEDAGWQLAGRKLLRRHRNGRFRSWIDRLRRIQRLSRLRLSLQQFRDEGSYDGPPLPCVIVAFQDRDAIMACFDEESQHMLEGSSEPTLCVVFTPQNTAEFAGAMQAVARFVSISHELFQLVEELQAWERDDAGRNRHRRDTSLRAT
jgi:hypothetical protein